MDANESDNFNETLNLFSKNQAEKIASKSQKVKKRMSNHQATGVTKTGETLLSNE